MDAQRRLELLLHDGVQDELVWPIVKLGLAQDDRDLPPALAVMLSALADHVEAALDCVREIADGIYLSALATFGVEPALRAQADERRSTRP